jgi:hypothetical protein
MQKICYCKQDIMSQCVAEDVDEQRACWFSSQSRVRKACMHLNTDINNHCWNPEAHAFSREYGVVRLEDVEEEICLDDEIIIDEFPATQRQDCRCCILHPCHELVQKANTALNRGGLADVEYWDIGTSCPEFMDEAMMKSTYNSNP